MATQTGFLWTEKQGTTAEERRGKSMGEARRGDETRGEEMTQEVKVEEMRVMVRRDERRTC